MEPDMPNAAPTPQVLVYASQAYRLELYLEPPGPGVEPYVVDVPRGLAVLSAPDWATCWEQRRFREQVQTVGYSSQGQPPALADAWATLPRKQAVAMVASTRDVATLEALAQLGHHADVRAAVADALQGPRLG
jgi:hypothetical protein